MQSEVGLNEWRRAVKEGKKGHQGERIKSNPEMGEAIVQGEKKGLGDNIGQSRGVRGPGSRPAST